MNGKPSHGGKNWLKAERPKSVGSNLEGKKGACSDKVAKACISTSSSSSFSSSSLEYL